jgi:glucose/arabinose dehydrogenase
MRLALAAALALTSAAHAQTVGVEDAFPGLTFQSPVGLETAPGQPDRVYILEKNGRVQTTLLGGAGANTFLDLRDRVDSQGEGGLLGLAFHPDYAENGRLFASYTAPVTNPQVGTRVLVSRVSEFVTVCLTASGSECFAEADSERVLLEVDQPRDNHNGGMIAFGPDGLLYVALGDGGGGGDEFENGQDPTTLLGALLRIGVDDVPEGEPYAIPEDNPFALTDGPERDEIYAYGFRNPWKFSFDAETGALWLGDVGQSAYEEVNVVEVGGNYGWNEVEGPACYPAGSSCDPDRFDAPVYSYAHGSGTGFSITGGFVYRGSAIPDLVGRYLYADYLTGRVWALDAAGGEPQSTLLVERYDGSSARVSALERGPDGEPYVVAYNAGRVFRLVSLTSSAGETPSARPSLVLAGPNPFRSQTAVEVAGRGRPVRVAVYDALGREVAVLHDGPAADSLRLTLGGRGLAPGVYVVQSVGADGVAAVRVVRTR